MFIAAASNGLCITLASSELHIAVASNELCITAASNELISNGASIEVFTAVDSTAVLYCHKQSVLTLGNVIMAVGATFIIICH